MIEQCIVGNFEVFVMGLVMGGVVYALATWSLGWVERHITIAQKERDLALGEALLKMQEELDNKNGI